MLDMDGLMFDTEALYRDAVIAAAADGGHDVPLHVLSFDRRHVRRCDPTAFRERFGNDFDFDLFRAPRRRFAETVKSQLSLKAGVVELLDLLDHVGLPRAISTSRVTKMSAQPRSPRPA